MKRRKYRSCTTTVYTFWRSLESEPVGKKHYIGDWPLEFDFEQLTHTPNRSNIQSYSYSLQSLPYIHSSMSFSLCKPLEPALQIRTTKAFLGLPITSKSLYLMGLCRKLFQLQTTVKFRHSSTSVVPNKHLGNVPFSTLYRSGGKIEFW